MTFRKGNLGEAFVIYEIIKQAQEYMKKSGINQWQGNYPNEDTIKEDIEQGLNYVCSDGQDILATVAVLLDGEKAYDKIYEGKWLTEGKYAAIHRVAVDSNSKGRGLGSKMISYVEDICHKHNMKSIRVDTHKDNIPMQKMLNKNNFKYCGIIYLENGEERIAFEKVL